MIYLEQQYCMINHLMLLKIQNAMHIKEVSMVYKFFDKNSSGEAVTLSRSEALATRDESSIKSEIILNQQLPGEFHKPILRKLEKLKVYSSFTDNIWSADLADIQLINKCNK